MQMPNFAGHYSSLVRKTVAISECRQSISLNTLEKLKFIEMATKSINHNLYVNNLKAEEAEEKKYCSCNCNA